MGVFHFLNCTNGTKSREGFHRFESVLDCAFSVPLILLFANLHIIERSASVGQRPMKSLPSVRPFVRPSLNFLKTLDH